MIGGLTELDVCAVVTTYRPSNDFPDNIQLIVQQVGLLVIVDDGDSQENKIRLKKWFGNLEKILLHHNNKNLGIARSLNIGINIAVKKGYQWALLLDDDSVVPANLTKNLLKALEYSPDQKHIAILGADYLVKSVKKYKNNKSTNSLSYNTLTRITSGSLLSLRAYDIIGPFNEDYFIDYVDNEYCLRANAHDFIIKNVRNTEMIHALGSGMKIGFIRIKSCHSPERQYYFFRNSTDVIIKYWNKYTLYSLAIILEQVKTVIKIIFFQDCKVYRVKLLVEGIKDAFNGQFGKIKKHLLRS